MTLRVVAALALSAADFDQSAWRPLQPITAGNLWRLFFMHFWGNDDALALATTLRRALDAMNVRR